MLDCNRDQNFHEAAISQYAKGKYMNTGAKEPMNVWTFDCTPFFSHMPEITDSAV